MKTKKLYLSINLLDDSEKVKLEIHTIDCYLPCILYDVFEVIGIRSEDVSSSILYDIASHIIELLINTECPFDFNEAKVVDSIAYQIAIDFIKSSADKCMWDITDSEHIVKINPCKNCNKGIICSRKDIETDDFDELSNSINDRFNSINERLDVLEKQLTQMLISLNLFLYSGAISSAKNNKE